MPTQEEKLARFREDCNGFRSTVFCKLCGSTCVDQMDVSNLQCYKCGHTAPWPASFGIARRGLNPPEGQSLPATSQEVADAHEGFAAWSRREIGPPTSNS